LRSMAHPKWLMTISVNLHRLQLIIVPAVSYIFHLDIPG
jgi:hypothetical protein